MKEAFIEAVLNLLNKELSFWQLIVLLVLILIAAIVFKPKSKGGNTYNFNGWFCNNRT